MPPQTKLGEVQQAIVDHVKGLEPKARATTQDLVRAIRKATGKRSVAKTSLFGAIRSLRNQGLIQVERVGRELRIGAGAGAAAAVRTTSEVKGAVERAAGKARAAVRGSSAPPSAAPPSVVGTKLAPGESLVLHVEKDVVHVLENVHGRVEHRKVSTKG